jgi:hypothetical protein
MTGQTSNFDFCLTKFQSSIPFTSITRNMGHYPPLRFGSIAIFSLVFMLSFIVCVASLPPTLVAQVEDFSALRAGSSISQSAPEATDLGARPQRRNEAQSEQTRFGPSEPVVKSVESSQQHIADETLHQGPMSNEQDGGNQNNVVAERSHALQKCPEEPQICSSDDCGGNVCSWISYTSSSLFYFVILPPISHRFP